MLEYISSSPDDLKNLIPLLLEEAGDIKIILLSGDLGAGKTTLVQKFGEYFKVREQVVSPTFSIVNEYGYKLDDGDWQNIYHIDLYRLENLQEAYDIGIEEYLYGGGFCFIEWPELIEGILPEEVKKIKIEILPDSKRKILFL